MLYICPALDITIISYNRQQCTREPAKERKRWFLGHHPTKYFTKISRTSGEALKNTEQIPEILTMHNIFVRTT